MLNLTSGLNDDFIVHLEELRQRLIIAFVAVVIGVCVGWLVYPAAYQLLAGPILASVKAHGGQIVTLRPADPFFTRLRLSGALGLILASPMICWQFWAFIRPGLTTNERKAVAPLVPMISLLFLGGAGMAYAVMPQVMKFFMSYLPHGVGAYIDFQQSIDLPLKLMLAFGLAFQLPIVLLGLVWLNILTPKTLLAQWRIAVVIMAILAAVLTPTGDPLNWSLMMAPLLVLYFGTILFAHRISRRGQ